MKHRVGSAGMLVRGLGKGLAQQRLSVEATVGLTERETRWAGESVHEGGTLLPGHKALRRRPTVDSCGHHVSARLVAGWPFPLLLLGGPPCR